MLLHFSTQWYSRALETPFILKAKNWAKGVSYTREQTIKAVKLNKIGKNWLKSGFELKFLRRTLFTKELCYITKS